MSAAATDLYWPIADHLGTVRDVVSGVSGLRVNHLDYDEHGVLLSVTGRSNEPLATRAVDAAFAGEAFVDELKLAHHGARWYDPKLERFISEDPAQADPNLYRYALNDPVNLTDPSGLVAQKPLSYLPALNKAVAQKPTEARAHAPSSGFSLFGREYVMPWDSRASWNPLKSAPFQATDQLLGKALGATLTGRNVRIDTASTVDIVGESSYAGAVTGGKALANSVASSLSLGFVNEVIAPTNYDLAMSYRAARLSGGVGTELATGLATGGLSKYAKAGSALGRVGKAALAVDSASNALGVGRGVYDVSQNGLTGWNALQVVGSAAGLGANVATGGRALGEIAGDARRVRLSFDPATLSSGGLGGAKISLAPKVNLNTNTAVGNFGVYEILVNGELHKIGKADLDRVTQSSGLPTRVHQQVRQLREVFGAGRVVPGEITPLGRVTTEAAKAAETSRILAEVNANGFIPLGNWKSYRPN